MKKTKLYQKIISVICAITLWFGATSSPLMVRATEQPILNSDFTEVNFSTYGINSQVITATSKAITKYGKSESQVDVKNLNQVVFKDKMSFTTSASRVIIGGKIQWHGIALWADPDGNEGDLKLYVAGLKNSPTFTFTTTEAGVNLRSKNLEIVISFEYVDYDHNGGNNDLKFAIWFNGICYGNQYYYISNCTEYLGNQTIAYVEQGAQFAVGEIKEAEPLTPNETYTKVNFETYGIDSQVITAESKAITKYGKSESQVDVADLNQVVFKDKLSFMTSASRVIIGGKVQWHGIALWADPDGNAGDLKLYVAGLKNSPTFTFTTADAGVNLRSENLEVVISFEYVDYDHNGGNNDLKFAIWFNGTCYGNQYYYISNCTEYLGNQTIAYVEQGAQLAVGEVKPADPLIPNESYTKVNFTTYGIAPQAITATSKAITKYGKSESEVAVADLNQVVFKDKISFLTSGSRVVIGGKIQWQGIALWADPDSNEGELKLYVSGFNAGPTFIFTTEEAKVDLRSKNLEVTISFEYVDHDHNGGNNDLKFAIWFNGICYGNQYYYISNCTQYLGNQTIVYAEKGAILEVGEVQVPEEPEENIPVLDETFTKVNFASYGIRVGVYEETKKGQLAAKGTSKQENLNRVIFSDIVMFSDNPTSRFIIGGQGEWQGISLFAPEKDVLQLYGSGFKTQTITFTSEEAGTRLTGESIKITLSFEYMNHNGNGGENDLEIGVWFNDKVYGDEYFYFDDVTDKLGNFMSVYIENSGALSIGSMDQLLQEIPVMNEQFQKINFDSFGFESGIYHCRKSDLAASGKQDGEGLDKTIFMDTIQFSDTPGGRLNIGGKETAWQGLGLHVIAKGQLQLNAHAGSPFAPLIFKSDIAGVDLTGEKIQIMMSFEYVDSDGDDEEDDIKFAIWFNGKAYKNQYYYLTNYAPEIGAYMGIYIPDDTVTVAIETTTQPLDFTEFGFTINWKEELRLNKKTK